MEVDKEQWAVGENPNSCLVSTKHRTCFRCTKLPRDNSSVVSPTINGVGAPSVVSKSAKSRLIVKNPFITKFLSSDAVCDADEYL